MANKVKVQKAIANKYSSTLSSGINNSDLTITVSDGTGLSASGGAIIIDEAIPGSREIIYIESVSGNTLTVATDGRGSGDTSAIAHNSGASVTDILIDDHINGIAEQFRNEHADDGKHTAIDATITVSGSDIDSSNKAADAATLAAGFAMNNDAALQGKEAGGTARDLIKRNTDDETEVGDGVNLVVNRLQAGVGLRLSGDQVIPGSNVEAQIEFDTEIWDDGNNFNTTTFTYTAPAAGRYQITYNPTLQAGNADKTGQVRIKVNGTEKVRLQVASSITVIDFSVSRILTLAATDTVTFFVLHNDSGNKTLAGGADPGDSFAEIEFLGRA